MPESLLAILKLCAVALLYLFFLRVLRAVWAEVSPARVAAAPATPRPQRARGRSRSGAPELVVVEPKERAGAAWPLGEEVTLGRASGCSVTLDDGYASQLHARVFRHDGGYQVEDLGSTNGTYVNGRRVTGPTPVVRGDQVRVGATVFEVRA